MKSLVSLTSEKFRTTFMVFYVLSSILPILIMMYTIYQYIRPRLYPNQVDVLMTPLAYTLLAMTAIPMLGLFLINWWIKSLEKLTAEVTAKSASLLSERVEITGKNEILLLQHHVNGLYGELQGKISELAEASQQLEDSKKKLSQMATKDDLTGLYNRRRFEPKLADEAKKAQKGGYDLSLVMIDVDGFRQYNQTHGHAAGDELLSSLGLLIRDYVRNTGIPFRYGGDEFAIILPKKNIEQAAAIAEKLKESAERLAVKTGPKGESGKLGISCGVVSYSTNFKGLLKEADRCVNEAVKRGRGSVVCLAPMGPEAG